MTSYEIDLISIHAAREGGDVQVVRCKDCVHFISIHAAREGGDDAARSAVPDLGISIHAAREGGDSSGNLLCLLCIHFNPRRP